MFQDMVRYGFSYLRLASHPDGPTVFPIDLNLASNKGVNTLWNVCFKTVLPYYFMEVSGRGGEDGVMEVLGKVTVAKGKTGRDSIIIYRLEYIDC